MSTHKYIDRICVVAVILSLLLTVVFMNGDTLGIQAADNVIGYENRLFDTSSVHTIDIVMDDWDSFISTCENEEYSVCAVVIDGESYKNVGIRAKGNTSLSSVSSMGSDRYSFKIEFDQYDSTKSYYGLDKLSLNNIIQDNTYMKDYLVYQMMGEFDVDAPLCSYVYITVNGEDWGLYLAVEGVEEAFLQRNYGRDCGELYKPDSTSFGGGRGNGRDFDFNLFKDQMNGTDEETSGTDGSLETPTAPDSMFSGQVPEGMGEGEAGSMPQANRNTPSESGDAGAGTQQGDRRLGEPDEHGGELFSVPGSTPDSEGMGSADVKLQYIDDDSDSYSNIFDNAKTDVSDSDQARLIASLKSLSSYENLERVLDVEEVLRYFVVHNFVVNDDSYTGSMIHNYYLYEEDGRLSMIPWDYNLAFGTFTGSAASSAVNDAIDDVLSDRPMQAWIFSDEIYTQAYHQLYAEFLSTVDISGIIEDAYELIASYVEKDPNKFCTYEEFESGVETLEAFCQLRKESVQGQLAGTIPSDSDTQNAASASLVNADGLDLSAMGTMSGGMGGERGSFGGFGSGDRPQDIPSKNLSNAQNSESQTETQGTPTLQEDEPPDHLSGPSDDGPSSEDITPPDNTELPENFDLSSMSYGNEQGTTDGAVMDASESPSGSRDFSMENLTPPDSQGSSAASSDSALILMGISILFLIGGLAFAFKYRK